MTYKVVRTDELYHHGILGQKWGVRRYQNKDGSLTEEGLKRYGSVQNAHEIMKKKDKLRAAAFFADDRNTRKQCKTSVKR